jgi:hypothetical protein
MRRKLIRLVFFAQCVWLVLFVDDRATVLLEVAPNDVCGFVEQSEQDDVEPLS